MKLTNISTALMKASGRTGLILKKYSPEILVVAGIAGIIGSTILACRATLKIEDVLTEHERKLDQIDRAVKQEFKITSEYTEENRKKDLTITYVQTAVDFIKLYGPSVTLGIAGVACIIGAHGIMRRRNVALMAAYKAVEEGFSAYRKRVVEEYGEDKDYMYKNGLKAGEIVELEVGEDGKTKKVKKSILVDDGLGGLSQYARRWNKQTSTQYTGDNQYNIMYLQTQQNYLNNILTTRGHVFLNEVYDHLGLDRSSAGQMVGWVKNANNMGDGDGYINFGLDYVEQLMTNCTDDFILDFNVDGVVYDLI